MRYLTCDPGERNFGWSLVEIKLYKAALRVKVIESSYLTTTIVNLTENDNRKMAGHVHPPFAVELLTYSRAVERLLARTNPDVVGTERFQFQGRSAGKTLESMSVMNGILLEKAITSGSKIHLYAAVTWKGWVNRIMPIQELYDIGAIRKLKPHSVDTVLMTLWMYSKDKPEHSAYLDIDRLKNAIRNLRLTEEQT